MKTYVATKETEYFTNESIEEVLYAGTIKKLRLAKLMALQAIDQF